MTEEEKKLFTDLETAVTYWRKALADQLEAYAHEIAYLKWIIKGKSAQISELTIPAKAGLLEDNECS
jgi:hypothetical protein